MDVASHMDDYERGDEDAIARVRAKDYIVDPAERQPDSSATQVGWTYLAGRAAIDHRGPSKSRA